MYIHIYIHTHTYIHAYTHTHMHTHTYIHTHTCIHTYNTYIYIRTYIHIRINIHPYIHLIQPKHGDTTYIRTNHNHTYQHEGTGDWLSQQMMQIQKEVAYSPFEWCSARHPAAKQSEEGKREREEGRVELQVGKSSLLPSNLRFLPEPAVLQMTSESCETVTGSLTHTHLEGGQCCDQVAKTAMTNELPTVNMSICKQTTQEGELCKPCQHSNSKNYVRTYV